MPTFPDDIHDEMLARPGFEHVSVFSRAAEDRDGVQPFAGAILRCVDDGFMVVEFGQSAEDRGYVTVRSFDRFGEQIPVSIIEVDGSVLIEG